MKTSIRQALAAVNLFLLAGCVADTQPSTAELARKPAPPTLALGDDAFCEAKDNSGKPCDTMPKPKAEPKAPAAAAPTKVAAQYQPSQCDTGAHQVVPVLGAMLTGKLKGLQDYCTSIGMGEGQQQSYQPAVADVPGGGCVWKGRSYNPGDSIRSSRDGTIYAGELYVNGQRFDILSNVGRGPNERFQGCDCGSASKKWGCV